MLGLGLLGLAGKKYADSRKDKGGIPKWMDPIDLFGTRKKAANKAFDKDIAAAEQLRKKIVSPTTTVNSLYGNGRFNDTNLRKAGLYQEEYDPTGMNQYRAQATRGEGVLSNAANQGIARNTEMLGQNLQAGAAQNASGTANAWSQLAQTGGLRGGQRGRMAMAGQNQLAAGQQGLRAGSAWDESTLRLQDEQNRIAQLQGLPAMEAAYRAPSLQNAQTKMGLLGMNREDNTNKYLGDLDMYKNKLMATAGRSWE